MVGLWRELRGRGSVKGSEGVIIIKMRGKANVKCFSKILRIRLVCCNSSCNGIVIHV